MCVCFMFSLWIEIIADKPFGKYVKFGMKSLMGLMSGRRKGSHASALASPINSEEEPSPQKKKRSYLNADLFGGAISDEEGESEGVQSGIQQGEGYESGTNPSFRQIV